MCSGLCPGLRFQHNKYINRTETKRWRESYRYNGKCVACDKNMFAVELVATSSSTAAHQLDDVPFSLLLLLNPTRYELSSA